MIFGASSLLFVFILTDSIIHARQPKILYANRKDIRILQVGTRNETNVLGVDDVAVVDFDWQSKSLFYSEVNNKEILRFYWKTSQSPTKVISTGLESPDGLAVDWVTKKLYWTDAETNRIELANLDGSHRKVLVWQDLDQPRALALLPQRGMMFWSDWGEKPKIERAGMDGSGRIVLVHTHIHWPNGLTVNLDTSELYWVDAKLKIIDCINFDGRNRRTIVKAAHLKHPFSLTLYGGYLYWTDWLTRSINSCNKTNGSIVHTVLDNIHSPMGLVALMPDRQKQVTTGCSKNNGGCSHLCLLNPVSYSCACPTGIRISKDNKTCIEGPQRFIVVARRPDIRIVSLDTTDHSDVVLPLPKKTIETAYYVEYDVQENYVYWSDNEKKHIMRSHRNGTGVEIIANYDIGNPDGLAVDWIARNLYWSDAGKDRIEVARLNGSSRKILVSTGLDEPRGVVVDPAEGYLYWSDWGRRPKIEQAELDGTNRRVLVNKSIGWPNGLAIDYQERKLYWGDAKLDFIASINLDGTNRINFLERKVPHAFGIAVLGDGIFWTDWQLRTLNRLDKHTKKVTKVLENRADLMGIKAVDIHLAYGDNPCKINNGDCSHLCFFKPSGHKCSCPLGMELGKDDKTCITPNGFLLISRRNDIRRVTLDTYKRDVVIPLNQVREASSLGFDISEERIYWVDNAKDLKAIYSAFMNGTGIKAVVRFGLEMPGTIAVDWIAKNIYWTDEKANRIEVARTDGRHRKVLLWENIVQPFTLAVNPHNGHIYWCDWYKRPKLEQADMNGENRKILVRNIGKPSGLTLDYEQQHIYWADIIQHTIERVDFSGQNKVKLLKSVPHPYGLTMYSKFVYFSDWVTKTIERADKETGHNRTRILDNLEYVMDVLAYHRSRQTGTNLCADNNGGCSHLCFSRTRNERYCGCPTHFLMNKDNRTCQDPLSFLLFSDDSNVRRVTFAEKDNPDLVLPVPAKGTVKSIDFDVKTGFIYWIEERRGKKKLIRCVHEDGTGEQDLIDEEKPYDLAIEPFSRSIYWTNEADNTIRFAWLNDTTKKNGVVFPKKEGHRPRHIVISPEQGQMFWTNMAPKPTIMISSLDGTQAFSLVTFDSGMPGDLAIDHEKKRIYWIDTRNRKIESVDFQGQNHAPVVSSNLLKPSGLTEYGDYVYWTDEETHLVERANKITGESREEKHGRFNALHDIVAVNRSRRSVSHPCALNNGGCSHICRIDRKIGYSTDSLHYEKRCACPDGWVLDEAQHNCKKQKCGKNEFQCAEKGNCIKKSQKCDGKVDCSDSSDEQPADCEVKCDHNTQITCGTKCIDKSKACDGTPDCPHESDEVGCVTCSADKFKCLDNKKCISMKFRCDGGEDCSDGSDEEKTMCNSKDNSTIVIRPHNNNRIDTSSILAGVVSGVVITVLILICGLLLWWRLRRTKQNLGMGTTSGLITTPVCVGPKSPSKPSSIQSSLELSKTSLSTYVSSQPSFYPRNITGASSVTSTSAYSQMPLNPPPSVITDQLTVIELHDRLSVISEDKVEPTPTVIMCQTCGVYSQSLHGSVRSHYSYSANGPPPPTPASSDILDDTQSSYSTYAPSSRGDINRHNRPHRSPHRTHKRRRHRHRRMPRMGSPISDSIVEETELLPMSRHFHGGSMEDNSTVMGSQYTCLYVETDQDPFAPPPTPCTNYVSEAAYLSEDSRPPSPANTERSIGPFPPPPSPTSQLQ